VSTTFKTRKIVQLLAAVALACAGAAQADSPLDGSSYTSLVASNAGTVKGVSFSANGGNLASTSDNGWVDLGVTDGASPGATWTSFGSVSKLTAPTGSGEGARPVSGNPFNELAATKLASTAVTGNRCQAAGSCNSQSDDVVGTAVHAVPEPETYALLAAGLGAIGFVAGRRRRY
jgi:hypothetical protein